MKMPVEMASLATLLVGGLSGADGKIEKLGCAVDGDTGSPLITFNFHFAGMPPRTSLSSRAV